jgi:hypothetical protein
MDYTLPETFSAYKDAAAAAGPLQLTRKIEAFGCLNPRST